VSRAKVKATKDARSDITIHITRFEHPNAMRIEIAITGDDEDARNQTDVVIMEGVRVLLERLGGEAPFPAAISHRRSGLNGVDVIFEPAPELLHFRSPLLEF
jgi:hypothetical protein